MLTVHKKLIPMQHGYAQMRLPSEAKILSIGRVATSGAVPVYVQLDNTHDLDTWVNFFVCMSNLSAPMVPAQYLGTCEVESSQAAHIYQIL